VKVTDISKFERQNPGLSVNIFGWKSGLYPLHVSKQAGREIDLLLLTDTKDPQKTHYVWIKDMARLLHKNNRYKERKHPCSRCLHVFSSEALLENHRNNCQGIGDKPQRTVIPKEGQNILMFTNHHKQMCVPYFEALNIPIEGCADNAEKSYTRQIAKQVPRSYCYVMVRSDGVAKDPVLHRGEKAVEHFLASLQAHLQEICEVLRKPADMTITETGQKTFQEAAYCHICGEALVTLLVSIEVPPTMHATSSCAYTQTRARSMWSSTTSEAMMVT